jgi:antitoxin YefM
MPTVTFSDAKTHLASLLTEVELLGEQVTITRSGRPVGVLISVDEYEGLLETLEILADNELRDAIRDGLAEISRGDVVLHDDLWRELDSHL